jgi:hypothetical protein
MKNIRERILCVYNKKFPDAIPIGIYTRYLPRGVCERMARNEGLGIIDYFPVVTMPGPPWHVMDGYLSETKNIDFKVTYFCEKGKIIQRKSYETPHGTVYQEVEPDSGGVGSEHIRKHWVESDDDYLVLKHIVKNAVLKLNKETLEQRKIDLGEDGVVLGRLDRTPYQKCLIELIGPEKFLIDLHTKVEPLLDLLETLAQKLIESFEIAIESDAEVLWLPDNVTSDMTPPYSFREYILPLYQKFAKMAQEAGKPLLVHMDGKIKALAALIDESRIDVIESFSLPDIGGDVPLNEAYSIFSNAVIIPSFPSNWALLSDEEIKKRFQELLDNRNKDKPFMIQFSEDIPYEEWQRVIPLVTNTLSDYNKK